MEKFIYPLLIVFISLLGGIFPLTVKRESRKFETMLNLSAGVILGVAFFHMLPESINLISFHASFFLAGGLLFLFLIERFITIHPCEVEGCEEHGIGIPAFIGFSIHNFFDGFALGTSMLVPELSFLTFLAIFLHKAPMAFALSTLLLTDGYSRVSTISFSLLFALVIPAGAVLSYLFLRDSSMQFAGYALSFSAGSFIYIALGDIVPHLHRKGMPKILSSLALLAGVIIMLIARNIVD